MSPLPPERRRDRRLPLTGHAVLRPNNRRGVDVFGGILDVSAGGMRLRVRPGSDVEPGDRIDVDLEVSMPSAPPSIPPIRLYGRGEVLRLDVGPEGSSEAAIRFESALEVHDGFGPGASVSPSARRVRYPARF